MSATRERGGAPWWVSVTGSLLRARVSIPVLPPPLDRLPLVVPLAVVLLVAGPAIAAALVGPVVWLAALVLPLLVPLLVWRARHVLAERPGFWWAGARARRAEHVVIVAGLIAAAGLMWWAKGHGLPLWGPAFVAVAGTPAAFALARVWVAGEVDARRVADVAAQERIEIARRIAADRRSAERVGLVVQRDGTLSRPAEEQAASSSALPVVPCKAAGGRWRLGVMQQDTTVSAWARWRDVGRESRAWVAGDAVVLPERPGDARALVVAESGAGKTQLLDGLMLSAVAAGWNVTFIDGKGSRADSEARLARLGQMDKVPGIGKLGPRLVTGFDCFNGTHSQVRETLMRAWPSSGGDGDYYRSEAWNVLGTLLGGPGSGNKAPAATCIADLLERGRDVSDLALEKQRTHEYLSEQVAAKLTRIQRATTAIAERLEPLVRVTPGGPGGVSCFSWPDMESDLKSEESEESYAPTLWPLAPSAFAEHAIIGDVALHALRIWMGNAMMAAKELPPSLVIVDEFAQFVTGGSDPADAASSLFETARSAGVGLVLAGQSAAALSTDERMRKRLLASGAAIFAGRSKDPEEIASLAGTVLRQESAGEAHGEALGSARAQHAYAVSPNVLRSLSDGSWVLIQGGGVAPFRGLPSGV